MNNEKETASGTITGGSVLGDAHTITAGADFETPPEPSLHDKVATAMILAIRKAFAAGTAHFDSTGEPLVSVDAVLKQLVDGPGYAVVERGKAPRRVVLVSGANRRRRRACASEDVDAATNGPELRAALERLNWGAS